MHALKRFLLPCLLVVSLAVFTAGPTAQAASSAPQQPLFTRLSADFIRGAEYYGRTVAAWFNAIARLVGLRKAGGSVADACQEQSDCSGGLACLNFCDGASCDIWQKTCVQGPEQIRIEPKYGACGKDDVCIKGTVCTSTCPTGVKCQVATRCLPPEPGSGSCAADLDCAATCASRGFPPIGVSTLRPMCVSGSCRCKVEEADPTLARVRCTDAIRADRNAVCPPGTTSACTDAGCAGPACPVRLTCLVAPEFGGTCYEDGSCTSVNCPEGASPFCDTAGNACRCRATKQEALVCRADADCAAVTCDAGEKQACHDGVCGCAKTTTTEQDIVCASAADCPAACAQGFSAACVDRKCACQRTTAAPVACQTVDQCGAVACPDGYEKKCLSAVCACARSVPQE